MYTIQISEGFVKKTTLHEAIIIGEICRHDNYDVSLKKLKRNLPFISSTTIISSVDHLIQEGWLMVIDNHLFPSKQYQAFVVADLCEQYGIESQVEINITCVPKSRTKVDREPMAKEFYREQYMNAKGKPGADTYLKFINYLFGTSGRHKMENILNMQKQLSFDEFIKLTEMCMKKKVKLIDYVDVLEDYTLKKKTVYLSLKRYLKNA